MGPHVDCEELTLETDDTPHHFVDLLDVHIWVILTDCIFLLDKCQPSRDDEEDQRPEPQVSAKRDETVFKRR